MSDTDMNYLQAVTSVSALARDNQHLERQVDQLTTGAARQAKTIRQLNEQLSAKETEVQVEQYNVEFVKQQARKTRFKHRDIVKALKRTVTVLSQQLRDALAQVDHMRKQVSNHEAARVLAEDQASSFSRTIKVKLNEIENLRRGVPTPMPEVNFVTQDQIARARLFSEPKPWAYRTKTIQLDQLSMRMEYTEEHEGDLRVVEAIAKQAATAMTRQLEDKIVEALMGKPMTRDERARAEYEMRMKQQRQTYGMSSAVPPGYRW